MLPKVLKQFQEIYPNVKVQVVEAHSMRLEELAGWKIGYRDYSNAGK